MFKKDKTSILRFSLVFMSVVLITCSIANTVMGFSVLGFVHYNGKTYLQTQYVKYDETNNNKEKLLGEYIGKTNEWFHQSSKYGIPENGYKELDSTTLGDLYTVKGYDKNFRVCILNETDSTITFFEDTQGITEGMKGKELYDFVKIPAVLIVGATCILAITIIMKQSIIDVRRRKMKKIVIISSVIILVFISAITIYILHMEQDNSIDPKRNALPADNSLSEKEIEFTRTYRIVQKLNYQDGVNENTYIVVDKFQEFEPYIIKLRKDLATELNEDYFYEFTFKGRHKADINYSNISELFNDFNVINISITSKKGMEQIQETVI